MRYAPILVPAPLKASHEYHQSLEALESAHIRNELKAIFRLWAGLEAATPKPGHCTHSVAQLTQ